ncbi:AcrR family transcriptional regulator [Tardiphaga robiniae]|uniref:TetR/AcrR family transcriptional regulator n=1 Tax=Tardiphaga robiniae TaxID=943830 RepID=UPI00285BADE7|nr:helix-turn-helix domain-containing protein [Tardiphaga robiniae]MDR6659366.1 AcrR family transcriptional regulator [Tardiphaga robiniae]
MQERVIVGRKKVREGSRERKKRATLKHVADTALRLFLANGYESTTLEAIAETARISRRSLFYYFRSKEEIILIGQSGYAEIVRTAVIAQSSEQAPLDAVKRALLQLAESSHSVQDIVIDKLLRSNETLRGARHAKHIAQEQAVFEALCEKWPDSRRRQSLRYVAMVAIGTLRLATDAWSQDNGKRRLSIYLRRAFADLQTAF